MGLTSLEAGAKDRMEHNASVALAVELGDTIKRIDGSEIPLLTPWVEMGARHTPKRAADTAAEQPGPEPVVSTAAKEASLNDMGFWHFDQIAAWGPGEIAWVENRLQLKGRIERDDWVGKAAALTKEL